MTIPRKCRAALAAALLVSVIAPLRATTSANAAERSEPPAASRGTAEPVSDGTNRSVTTPFTSIRSVTVDPGTGRVFVAGDDGVAVLTPDGTLLKTIAGVPGAWGTDATQGSIWVASTTDRSIVRIDPVAMTVAKRYAVGHDMGDDLTVIGTTAWTGFLGPEQTVGRFDLVTSAYSAIPAGVATRVERRGSSTTDAIFVSRGEPSSITRRSTTTPYAELASWTTPSSLSDATIDATGSHLWYAPFGSQSFAQLDALTLETAGPTYPSSTHPAAVEWSAAGGGSLVGFAYDHVEVYATLTGARISSIPTYPQPYPRGFAVAPDAGAAYYVTHSGDALVMVDLRPTIGTVTPSSVVQGNPTEIEVTGSSLGGTTSVTIGGVPATPIEVTPTTVRFVLPGGTPVGSQALVLNGTAGPVAATLTVAASTGAVLRGTVRSGSSPVPGAELRLSGGALTSPLSTTSTADGTYAFPAVGYGSDYQLDVQDPAGRAPDQVVRGLALVPNQASGIDLELSRPLTTAPVTRRTQISAAKASALLLDPATGRIIVSAGDEVIVLDGAGGILARLQGIQGARSLALVGPSVYVGTDRRVIKRIDLGSLAVTGSWNVGRDTTGSIATANGRIWFVRVTDIGSASALSSLDPATGSITDDPMWFSRPSIWPIAGEPDRLLVSENDRMTVVEADAAALTEVARTPWDILVPRAQAPLVATAATGRIYASDGFLFRLSDLTFDGNRPGLAGPPAVTTGHGGLVAFGTTVERNSGPIASHAFGPTASASGLDATGSQLITVEDGAVVVRSLAPVVTSTTALQAGSPTVTLTGSGLGTAASVTVDGVSVPFHHVTPTSVAIDLEDRSTGPHEVIVTTDWGPSAPVPLWFAPLAPSVPAAAETEAHLRLLTVTWDAPASDGGRPILGYRVTFGPRSKTCETTTERTCTVEIGPSGSTVTATVQAYNEVGYGPGATVSQAMPAGPRAPAGVIGSAGPRRVDLTWDAAAVSEGDQVLWYTVCASSDPAVPHEGASCTSTHGAAPHLSFRGLQPATTYYFRVQANSRIPDGAWSPPSDGVAIPADFAPLVSWDAFVAQQLTDFAGSPGTTASRAAAVALLTDGTLPPAEFIAEAIAGPWYRPNIAPAARLYWAYFGRIPDHGGLEYWTKKRRTGTTLIRISASFAGSSEFQRTYGKLSNTAFVDLVYQNVLGRPGDPGGRSYWIGKLNRGASRGQVMANFSESAEYVRKTAGRVGVVEVFAGMLDRSPTAEELDLWQDRPVRTLIDAVRLGDEYADRVS